MIKIAMLSTGEEVLHGDILDTNAAWLSERFFAEGFSLVKRSTVGDSLISLREELTMLALNNDVVIVNGGLGPTTDDLSASVAAEVAGKELVLFPEWLKELESFFESRGVKMPESNLKQAMLPDESTIIPNPIGTACGFKMQIHDSWFYFTPGVPREFKRMVDEQILPDLKKQHPDMAGQACSKLYTFGSSESSLSDLLDPIELPDGYVLGYRSYLPFIEVKLFGPQEDLDTRMRLLKIIHDLIGQHVVSVDEPMLDNLGHLVSSRSITIATAEQSTQGWLANWLQSNEQVEEACGHGWVLGKRVDVGSGEKDMLAATLALGGATLEKCATDVALVTGKQTEQTFTVVLATQEGEWGQTLTFNRKYSSREAEKKIIGTVAGDMLRRYLDKKPIFVKYSALKTEKEIYVPQSMISK
ncbi:CinA family nicotinamide mononucleotide deamidase-related protein [Vibrio sonorensis]|uniref:CinA family nicotinamide mononucleotide deamidase-related protein n=1 Tax=Vibrio sonorensis TaxID=1004316 RepID=UPI0008DAC944|nr:CinA family nicotinamide mononucleotide deamidase-related protein [Vibrio sonorensis]